MKNFCKFLLFFIAVIVLGAVFLFYIAPYSNNNSDSNTNEELNASNLGASFLFIENSIVKDNNKVSASFRQDLEGGAIDNTPISHRIMEYEANCDESLGLINVRNYYFNKEKLIKTTNNPKGYRSLCADINGEYIYNKMCKIEYKCNMIYEKARTLNKEDTVTKEDYYYDANRKLGAKNPISINEYGEVVFNNKVVLTDDRLPMSENTVYALEEFRFLYDAQKRKPKEGCDPNSPENGYLGLGCFMGNPEE